MSTIAPHQLPTPSQIPAQVPTPAAPIAFAPADVRTGAVAPQNTLGSLGRSRSTLVRRIAIGGVAGVVAIALGIAGVGLAGGGDSADARAAEREQRRQEREEERDEEVSGGETSASNPFESGGDPAPASPTAGNANVDVDATYAALFGATPDASTVSCIESAAQPVIADVQAVADGTATSVDQVTSGLAPFAQCVAIDDFDAAMIVKASGLVAPLQLDDACARSVLATFTPTDRLDVLVTAVVDPATYDQRVFNTFTSCAV